MEDANGYLKRLYEDKISQLEQSVKDLSADMQRLKKELEQCQKDLEAERSNVLQSHNSDQCPSRRQDQPQRKN